MKTVVIPMKKPHSEKQKALVTWPGSVVAFTGRRWGKTMAGIQRIFYHAARKPGLYWWVGLSWRSASMKRAWREAKTIARGILRALDLPEHGHIREAKSEIVIPGLLELWFRTAENEDSLAGEGIRGVVLDEFSLMRERVWTEYVAPTLTDFGGWVAMLGVPKGKNWAWREWVQAGEDPAWLQIHATSYENPHIDHAKIDELRERLPDRIFRQEFLAEILDDAGQVFRHVVECATAEPQDEAVPGHEYVFGVDWGRVHDYTVIAVLDVTLKALVYLDRFTGIEYAVQVNRLKALYRRFRPHTIVAEANAMGLPLIESLQREGYPVVPFTTTQVTKQNVIDALALAFENREIRILPDDVLIAELQAYQGETMPSGRIRYGAPEGLHDDTVMALALAWHVVAEPGLEVLFEI